MISSLVTKYVLQFPGREGRGTRRTDPQEQLFPSPSSQPNFTITIIPPNHIPTRHLNQLFYSPTHPLSSYRSLPSLPTKTQDQTRCMISISTETPR